jgi:hypothetical protein
MGKDREGKFHPRKGKPSGDGTAGLKDINPNTIHNYLEVADKYTVGEEEPASNIKVRHPNRNVDKREDRSTDKRNNNSTQSKKPEKNITGSFTGAVTKTKASEIESVNKERFTELNDVAAQPAISIYIETHSSGVEKNEQKDVIAFKNALQQVTYQLRQKDVDQTTIESLLQPGYDLLKDEKFWFTSSKGLAVFFTKEECRYIKLPYVPRESITVNSRYFLSPLVPLITKSEYFYLLVLSKKQARLYRANRFGMTFIDIPEMPNGIDDVVHLEEKEDQKLFKTESAGAGQGANYHGIGAGKPDEKGNIKMYCDEVDETIWDTVLKNENVPLLLAGVEYLIPIYKSVAKYKFIADQSLTGSHEYDDLNSLYHQAMEKMEPYFNQRHEKALEMYGNQSATQLTTSIESEVIPAAHYSQVSQLFVLKDAHIWGAFDEINNQLSIHESEHDGDEDLVDKTIIKTIMNGGEVHVLDKAKMPADSKLAACLRF